MKRYLVGTALAAMILAIAGCNADAREESRDDEAEETSAADEDAPDDKRDQSESETDLTGARALIEDIYDTFVSEEPMEFEALSPDLTRTLEESGLMDPEMGLGFDPFCACQDFGDVSYEITRLEATGPERAEAEVRMTSFGTTNNFRLLLVDVRGDPVVEGWRVDDIGTVGEPMLRQQAADP